MKIGTRDRLSGVKNGGFFLFEIKCGQIGIFYAREPTLNNVTLSQRTTNQTPACDIM